MRIKVVPRRFFALVLEADCFKGFFVCQNPLSGNLREPLWSLPNGRGGKTGKTASWRAAAGDEGMCGPLGKPKWFPEPFPGPVSNGKELLS